MVKNNKCAFVIPFNLPWNWSADYQKQTCLELAKKYKVIAYMQQDRKFFLKALFSKNNFYPKHKNIKLYFPYNLIPFQRFQFIKRINDIVSFKIFELLYLNKSKKVLWIFDPIFYPLLKYFKGITIYDCVDLVSNKDSNLLKHIQEFEKQIIKNVDYFYVNSFVLAKKHSEVRRPTAILPQGFRVDDYRRFYKTNICFPKDRPNIGFIGAINQRIDFDLITNLIIRNPQWNFIFWGPQQDIDEIDSKKTKFHINRLLGFKNVVIGKSENRAEVPSVIKQFDVGIIPYDINQAMNYHCYPMKVFEYFYEGKPVVSTGIEELKRFPEFVKIANDVRGWEKEISLLLKNTWSQKHQTTQKKLAEQNSWQKKIEKILTSIKYR